MVPGWNAFGDGPLRGTDGSVASMDNLERTLTTAAGHLRSGLLDNEQQVKTSIILPILRALGWDDADPREFRAEYRVKDAGANVRRVDYVLLDRDDDSPLVFFEAKAVDRAGARAVDQLFDYGSNRGVPFLVLTDGARWDFYLSMAGGHYDERRFYSLDLDQSDKVFEHAEFLKRHLDRDRVRSGNARRAAEDLLESNRKRDRARRTIPDIFKDLLQRPDETILDRLADQVKARCGTRPETADVEEYLRDVGTQLKDMTVSESSRTSEPRQSREPEPGRAAPSPGVSATAPATTRSKIAGFVFDGEEVRTRWSMDALIEILKRFDNMAPDFMERYDSRTAGRIRKRVARDKSDLIPGRADLVEQYSRDLGNGWWLNTDPQEVKVIKRLIETACEVAGVRLGDRLRLIEE